MTTQPSPMPVRRSWPRAAYWYFSTNAQRFKLDEALRERFAVRDVSAQTLPVDFERNPKIHRCFELRPS